MSCLVILLCIILTIPSAAQINAMTKAKPNSLQGQKCKKLIAFRNRELFNVYKKEFDKYQLYGAVRKNVDEMKADLLNNTKWSRSEAGLTVAIIAKNIQTTCNLINNLLEMHPAARLTGMAINKTEKLAHIYLQAIKSAENLQEAAEKGAVQAASKELASSLGVLGQASRTIWDHAEDIMEMLKLTEDHTKLKSEVQRAVDMMDKEITKYETMGRSSKEKVDEAWVFKQAIDEYLIENCKDDEPEKELFAKKINKDNDTRRSPIPQSPISEKNRFYVFLSALIYLDHKVQTVISPAMPVDGRHDQDLTHIKKEFVKMIDEQILANVKDEKFLFDDKASKIGRAMTEEKARTKIEVRNDILKTLEKNGYESVSVHFGKPYSKNFLTSINECYDAIETFKSSQIELLEGMSTPIFIHVN